MFSTFKFPAGELQVKYDFDGKMPDSITHHIKNSDDIIELLQICDIIKAKNGYPPDILIPYLPFSRMDRRIDGYSFSLKVFAELLNTIGSKKISTYDVHSGKASLLIYNFQNLSVELYQREFLKEIDFEIDRIVLPDEGASERYRQIVKTFPYVQGYKSRDKDGNVTDIGIYGDVDGKNCLVLDDICDGGATFLKLGDKLKQGGAKQLALFVTHGIFSKGLEDLLKMYSKIGCTNSINQYEYIQQNKSLLRIISL